MTESFEDLLNESFSYNPEGSVIVGTVIRIENDLAIIDVGLKSEGRVPLKEFVASGQAAEIKPGDTVEVYMERFENRDGEVILSRDKARREEAWIALERQYNASERIEGIIVGRVKGGFTVDLNGVIAFLPGSQVDIRPIRDFDSIMNTPQPFQILKLDRARGNIVISRRAVLEESRAEERAQLISTLKEGMQLSGVVKNITDYGAFVDLGGVDGLLHVTDMSWRRVNHPSEVVNIGQQVEVVVTKFSAESQRISLGMKQLLEDPWSTLSERYPRGTRVTGRVSNITDYGAFVELESGIEGLVHISEMSWTKKNIHPGKIVSTSQEVEVVVLDIDREKRRISLGMKQTQDSPWVAFSAQHPPGSIVEGEVKNTTEFGLFIGLDADIDGMVHFSDLSWEQAGEEAVKQYQKGDRVQAKVLDVNTEKERVSLGIKQLSEDPFESGAENLKRGDVVTVVVSAVQDNGIEVSVNEGLTGFIKRADLARDRDDQHPDRFAVGDRVDAKITQLDMRTRKLSLSIKAQEAAEEKAAMDSYGSSSSGASLGDILTAAMKDARQDDAQSEVETADADSAADKSSETSDSEPKAAKKTPKKSASTSAAKSKTSTAAKETAEPEDSESA